MKIDLREKVLERCQGLCEKCGRSLPESWALHHRKLRSQGGKDVVQNFLALHHACHNMGTDAVHMNPANSIKNGLALNSGVSIGYSNRKWNDDRYDALSGGNGNYDNSKINSYGIQIGLAKYNRLFDNFYFTISGNLGYVYELVNSEFGYSSASIIGSNLSENYGRSNLNNLNLFITPGFSYFLSRKIAINANFGDIGGRYGWGNGNTENYFTNVYNGFTTVTNSDQNRDVSEFNFRFRLASSIGLGVQYFIK
jgi:hypothetical protein